MANILTWLLCFCTTISCLANDSIKTTNIIIVCTTSDSYCQGKSPDINELEALNTPKKAQMNLYLYALDSLAEPKNIPIVCGEEIEIQIGKYIISSNKILFPPQIEDYGLIAMVRTNDEANRRIIEVTAEANQVFQYNYHHYCDWQLNYNLPVPNRAGQ